MKQERYPQPTEAPASADNLYNDLGRYIRVCGIGPTALGLELGVDWGSSPC